MGPALRIAEVAEPLPPLDDATFAAPFGRYADCRVMLLGECSHGTSEFYRTRAAITQRLIERNNFMLVAVEADWPDASAVNGYVRHHAPRATVEPMFRRFPLWMWRNVVAALVDWMRDFNQGRASQSLCRVSLLGQFDAHAWFDETSAVTPLGPQHTRPGAPETYPFGR
jgi:erythromycin esterase-like protein